MSEPDDLLWQLPRAQERDDGAPPPDATLMAYRGGTLPSSEAAQIEWDLAGSRRGRMRLAELAGVRIDALPRSEHHPGRWAAVALAVAATILIGSLLVLRQQPPERPLPRALPEFALRVEGLASTRDEPGAAESYADGTVRVVVEPVGNAVAGLRFAAYRAGDGELTRLAEPAEVTVEAARGSATLTASAEDLVGAAAGTRPFFVVVSERPDLPDRLPVTASDPEAALAEASRGKAYRVTLTILNRTDGAP